MVEDNEYVGRKAVADAFGVSEATVHNRVKSDKFPQWSIMP